MSSVDTPLFEHTPSDKNSPPHKNVLNSTDDSRNTSPSRAEKATPSGELVSMQGHQRFPLALNPAMDDPEEMPEQVVSRSSYLELKHKIVSERIAFLKEQSQLRQMIVRLESALNNMKEERLNMSPKATTVSSFPEPDWEDAASLDGAGSARISPSASRRDLVAVTSLQTVPLKEIHDALANVEVVEIEKELHQNEMAQLQASHEQRVAGLIRERNEVVQETRRQAQREERRVSALKNSMKVERERYRQEAAAAAKAQLDEARLTIEKVQHRYQTCKKELAAAQEKAEQLKVEDSRKTSVISQLQQQLSVLMEERSEMKSALQTISMDQQRQTTKVQQLTDELQQQKELTARLEKASLNHVDQFAISQREERPAKRKTIHGASKALPHPSPPNSRPPSQNVGLAAPNTSRVRRVSKMPMNMSMNSGSAPTFL